MSDRRRREQADGDSLLTIVLALCANAGVGAAKLAAGLLTGSGALLSEAAHSVGDTATELLLLVALRRSGKPADRRHPFGYGKESYFWTLLASVAIFTSGALFSVAEGLHTILGPRTGLERPWVNYVVLALAAILEGASLRQGLRQSRRRARLTGRSTGAYVREPDDPTVKSVVLEDSAAVAGLAIAAAGVALHQITGSQLWDGAASIGIGALLMIAAFLLLRTCEQLLIGRQADRTLTGGAEALIEEQPEVEDVVDLLTMMIGPGRVLLCVRVDFVDTYTAADLERACLRMDADLRSRFPDLSEVFIQPVSRSDPDLRDRVLARYGRELAEPGPVDPPAGAG
jgi:cation diffusion facilitator family transporter